MNREEKLKLLAEKEKRMKLTEYSQDFSKFAEEQIQIVTKDATQGFVPFRLNDAQKFWEFDYEKKKSLTNDGSLILKISNLKKKNV